MDRATSTEHQDQDDYGTWTPAFEQLHEAVLTGASPEEIRQLEATELNELATTNTDRRLTVPTLDRIDVDGSGSITFPDLVTTTLRTTINGSGTVTLGGTADAQEVAVPGTGIYAGDRFTSKTAKASIPGSGIVNLNVSDSLDATVSGSGIIRYQGNPTVTKQISGTGEVTPK